MNGGWNLFSLLGKGPGDISKCFQGRNTLHGSAVGCQPLEPMTLGTQHHECVIPGEEMKGGVTIMTASWVLPVS